MIEARHGRLSVLVVTLVLVTSACGQMPATEPQASPTPAATAESSSPSPGAAAQPVTFGDLAERSNRAWSGVRSFRVTFTGQTRAPLAAAREAAATPGATPSASPVPLEATEVVSVREVVLPGEQRQSVTGLGDADFEAIVSGERLFVRGPLVRQIDSDAATDAWIVVDPSGLPAGSALSQLLGGLPSVPAAPLATLPERLWPQVVRQLSQVEFDARDCTVYGAADTIPATGSRIDYAIALDGDDLPCFIETSSGGVTRGRIEYTQINSPLTIATPAAATPVRVPPALASPVPRD